MKVVPINRFDHAGHGDTIFRTIELSRGEIEGVKVITFKVRDLGDIGVDSTSFEDGDYEYDS